MATKAPKKDKPRLKLVCRFIGTDNSALKKALRYVLEVTEGRVSEGLSSRPSGES